MAMETETIVFYPSGGVGHLTPTVELAKLFILHNFKATIVLIDSPSPSSTITSVTSAITSSNPSISFHRFPPPPSSSPPPAATHPLVNSFHLRRLNNPLLLSYLTLLSQSTRISALVLDFFCTAALDVAAQLLIPSYFFFSSNASNLSASLRLPSFLPTLPSPLKDLGDAPLHFPGLPPIPASHFSIHYQDPNGQTYPHFVSMFEDMAKADGIIVNTFEALERRAVEALAQGPFPKTYCIGPLLSPPPADEGKNQRHACLTWLDGQPKGSVVFLCFGSMGNFAEAQLKEIAVGLERSGQRFLWVARNPKGEDPEKPVEAFLPEGFLERIEGKGLVVKSWAPQTAVLSHEAVGGFVTHCGWNSALEGVMFGVAMIAWPLYAEQWLNKVILVEEARLAVGMEGYDKEMVKGEEVEKKVRWLMETEEGKELKGRAAAAKEEAIAARKVGGSSDFAWTELVRAIRKD